VLSVIEHIMKKKQKKHIDRSKLRLDETIKLEDIKYKYFNQKMSLGDIAKEYNCTRQYIYKIFEQNNVQLVNKSKARIRALEKGKVIRTIKDSFGQDKHIVHQKKEINEKFFNSWTPEMAYVLGLVFTDGNLTKKRKFKNGIIVPSRFSISQKEPEILEKVLQLMNSKVKIYKTHNKLTKSYIHSIYLESESIYNDLNALGLHPNKSRTITFPSIPLIYARHFIRGCWDGDGSILVKFRSIRVKLVSGSNAFIQGLKSCLENLGIDKIKIYEYKNKKGIYEISINNKIDIYKFYILLYYQVNSSMYLNRKHEIINSFFNILYDLQTDKTYKSDNGKISPKELRHLIDERILF